MQGPEPLRVWYMGLVLLLWRGLARVEAVEAGRSLQTRSTKASGAAHRGTGGPSGHSKLRKHIHAHTYPRA